MNLSDEEFLQLPLPGSEPKVEETSENKEEPVEIETGENNITAEEVSSLVQKEEDSSENTVNNSVVVEKQQKNIDGKSVPVSDDEPKSQVTNKAVEPETKSTADYEGFYNKVMVPFKANGKMIELKTPEEAVQLMQMGANYTQKMQALKGKQKLLTMLENNGLLDEGKLSFLIDIEKKNPEAIKKLVKEAGIDPLEIDITTEPTYLQGNHAVTDEEVNFRSTLEELNSEPTGKETLQSINNDWDQASKEVLWKNPQLMKTIHEQREAGIYSVITAELDRQKTLGTISLNTPFLEAYKLVGDKLMENNGFAHLPIAKQVNTKQGQVVDQKAALPKPALKNGDKAKAASNVRSNNSSAKPTVNLKAMSDDEFMKFMATSK